jgi:gibberellin A4 carboxyl methyltransferase
MPTLTGMKPEGYYDRNSSYQQSVMHAVIGWGEEAIGTMPLPDESQPFVIADYGCSEGKNSIVAAGHIVEAFRRRRPEQSICVIHADLPSNNFNQLFRNLYDPSGSNYCQTLGRPRKGVFPMACGGSFFGPQLAPGSVHFGMSFLAVEWMDRVPEVPIPESIVLTEGSPAAQEAFSRQADDDLTRFYASRAEELAPGGKLLLIIPGSDGVCRASDGLYDVLNDAACDLVESGHIARERYERFVMPVYFRTLEELTSPLKCIGSGIASAFSIDRSETLELPIPFEEERKRTGDNAAYAIAYTGFLRAFSEPVVAGGLFGEDPGRRPGVDALYDRIERRLLADPDRYRVRNIEVAVLLARR